jgi:hypothetical protein
MLPPRARLDPEGYYARLGLEPAATRADVVTAFRSRARLLHPDVPKTGDTKAFLALKQAYDVLSNRERRAAYDRKAREPMRIPIQPEAAFARPAPFTPETVLGRQPRLFDIPVVLWIALGAFLCLCVYQAATHLLTAPKTVRDDIKPNAVAVQPLSPSAHLAVLYGPRPVRLGGDPNFYVVPSAGPAVLWRLDPTRSALVPLGQLPLFSSVQAVRLVRQNGMIEIVLNDHANGFISADHLTPGNPDAARQAYCSYNAGPTPQDGEMLDRRGFGSGTIDMENRAMQPAVVKLRDETGAVALSVFLAPGSHAVLDGLPEGTYFTEFAIGELWSRACNTFAAGMRAKRMDAVVKAPGNSHIVVTPDSAAPDSVDIPDQAFERK